MNEGASWERMFAIIPTLFFIAAVLLIFFGIRKLMVSFKFTALVQIALGIVCLVLVVWMIVGYVSALPV